MLSTDATVAWVMRATGCSEDDARLALAAHADVRESERLNRVIAALLGMREARAQKARSDAARARRAQERRLADWREHYSQEEAADPIAEAQARAKAKAEAEEARQKAVRDGIARMAEARRIGEERHAAARADRVRRWAASTAAEAAAIARTAKAAEVPDAEEAEQADWVRDLVQDVLAEVRRSLLRRRREMLEEARGDGDAVTARVCEVLAEVLGEVRRKAEAGAFAEASPGDAPGDASVLAAACEERREEWFRSLREGEDWRIAQRDEEMRAAQEEAAKAEGLKEAEAEDPDPQDWGFSEAAEGWVPAGSVPDADLLPGRTQVAMEVLAVMKAAHCTQARALQLLEEAGGNVQRAIALGLGFWSPRPDGSEPVPDAVGRVMDATDCTRAQAVSALAARDWFRSAAIRFIHRARIAPEVQQEPEAADWGLSG